ncbi:MAG: hypothetical protein KJ063_16165 [Anaerolineae bacterium]|nr:hypothetical protein [Anaerolineae bacterium]
MRKLIWEGTPWEAFKSFAIIFSFTVNLITLIVLLIALPLILPIVSQIATPIVGGLNDSFVQMSEAHIVQTIEVNDSIPVVFTLPLSTTTKVRLIEPVPIQAQTAFILPGGGGTINGLVNLTLAEGLELPVALNLEVEVNQTVPVNLAVEVDIPLAETELGVPFRNLQGIFNPLYGLLRGLPGSNEEFYERLQEAITTSPDEGTDVVTTGE